MKCPKCGNENTENTNFCKDCGSSILPEMSSDEEKYFYHKRYKIKKPLKTGGMSTIYLANDLTFDDLPCVIKEMSDVFKDAQEKEYAVQKFREEALILARLRHPNIPVVSNHFIENGKYYIIMDYIEGINLEDLLMGSIIKGLAEEDVIDWGIQICEILEYLHSRKPPIIHRDIKPSNFIKREVDGQIILIDFGIAKIFEPKKVGTLIGTPGYIAPEQYAGQVDIRTDIFALGVTIHQLLTGKDPGQGMPFDFPPVTTMRPDVSEGMEKILDKALQRDPDKRFNSAGEFRNALINLRDFSSIPTMKEEQNIMEEIITEQITDKKSALKLKKGTPISATPSSDLPVSLPLKQGPPAMPSPPPAELKDMPKLNIRESPVKLMNSAQLHSFHGKEAIKKVLNAFIGIDIGTQRIKIIKLNIDDSYYVYPKDIAIAEVPPDTIKDGVIVDPKTVGLFIRQILDSQNIEAKRAVVSLPPKCTHMCSFYIAELPPGKMEPAIMEEAKNHFNFPLDKAKVNYEMLEVFVPEQIGKIQVIVWAVPYDVISAINKTMQYAKIRLADTEIEPFAIRNTLEILMNDQHKQNNVAVISLGASSVNIYVIRNSRIWYSKSFPTGGNELTNSIADKININAKQAENLKTRNANMDISKASHMEYVLFKVIEPFIGNITEEINKCLEEYNKILRVNIPIAILLCGGSCLLKNIDKFIERKLCLKTDKFELPISKKVELNTALIEELGSSFMVALGLTLGPFLRKIDMEELERIEEELMLEEKEEIESKKKKKGIWSWFG